MSVLQVIGFIGYFILLWLLISFFLGSLSLGFYITLAFSVIMVVGIIVFSIQSSKARTMQAEASRKAALRAAESFARQNAEKLARRKLQIGSAGPYGVDSRAWQRELRNTVRGLADRSPELLLHEFEAMEAIERIASERAPQDFGGPVKANMSPEEFEIFCSEELSSGGWTTRLTTASGDQGADIIAEKGGLMLVVQCKFHRRPVGNKAVQEVHAAQAYYGGGAAAVVTNATFTPSAEALAKSTGVFLLHYAELRTFSPTS